MSDLRMLAMCFIGLALGFLALAFPLALDDQWTCAAWAAQGATLAWFGVRNGSRLLAFAGAALQVAAAVAYVQAGPFGDVATPFLNGPFLAGVGAGAGRLDGCLELRPRRAVGTCARRVDAHCAVLGRCVVVLVGSPRR